MIYLESSVALAHLLVEDRRPPKSLWDETLLSSRLLEYELWTAIHSRGLAGSHGEAIRLLMGRVSMLELAPSVLARALEPFPALPRCGRSMRCTWRHAPTWPITVSRSNSRVTTGA